MAHGKFIAYYRVSTARQGRSGLGLEAQRKAVADHLNGGAWELVAEFTEVESGKRNDRPELAWALDLCRKQKATLLIAKLIASHRTCCRSCVRSKMPVSVRSTASLLRSMRAA
jgi:DNA invertase Pin-like site-specific DNA recombinase